VAGAEGLTVVSWNAQGSHRPDITAAAAALGELAPDVVLLQEIQHRQLRELAAAMDMPEYGWRFKHWGVRIPAEGLGVLARVPLIHLRSQVLAHPARCWDWRRRVALHCTVAVQDRGVRIVDVHLGTGVTGAERLRQIDALLAAAPLADLIAGDLNAFPRSKEMERFADSGWVDAERRLHPGSPPPATNWEPGPHDEPPTQRLDYVLLPEGVAVDAAWIPVDWARWGRLSDHVPVVVRARF
jgi:endonuclease/exonuclease/phosphatase family metal-dependent hydrolase